MGKFTKMANVVFRLSILAAFGVVVWQFATESQLVKNMVDANGALNLDQIDFSGLLSQSSLLTGLLFAAAILSIVAFKAAKTVVSIIRTVVLFMLAGFSSVGTVLFGSAQTYLGYAKGVLSAADLENVKTFINTLSEQGLDTTESLSSLVSLGTLAIVVVGVVLFILLITSIFSIRKTFKED